MGGSGGLCKGLGGSSEGSGFSPWALLAGSWAIFQEPSDAAVVPLTAHIDGGAKRPH